MKIGLLIFLGMTIIYLFRFKEIKEVLENYKIQQYEKHQDY